MNSTKVNNLSGETWALFALLISYISVLFCYVTYAFHAKASLIYFWLPAFALFVFLSFTGVDEYKKLNDRAIVRKRTSLTRGLFCLVMFIIVLAMKNWKWAWVDMVDACTLGLIGSCIKDCIIDITSMRQFFSARGQQ
ncbi:hypothetical protein [Undibacterium sp. TS12]|uniref:hypothetical protein n=1 Tax=Undibacterium sp. TS12 TaxID=2908202 RepID=UPI001F4CCC5F|nr:hypothetical protein [Undibacterium sp. TS12]MCH8622451.1 hypothetical protein [Undibacterium sp. TS12]